MKDIDAEIERVKKAIETTKSPYLKADYKKHLHKLIKIKRFG